MTQTQTHETAVLATLLTEAAGYPSGSEQCERLSDARDAVAALIAERDALRVALGDLIAACHDTDATWRSKAPGPKAYNAAQAVHDDSVIAARAALAVRS